MTDTVDIDQIMRDHWRVKQQSEDSLTRVVAHRFGTVSLKFGHDKGFRNGARAVLEMQAKVNDLTAAEVVAELRKRGGSLYWPIFMDDPRCWVVCDRCHHNVLIDAEGICPDCNNDFTLT